MTNLEFYGIFVLASVTLPLLASFLRLVRWRYKAPVCWILSNLLTWTLVGALDPKLLNDGQAGIGMMFGVFISGIIILGISAAFSAKQSS